MCSDERCTSGSSKPGVWRGGNEEDLGSETERPAHGRVRLRLGSLEECRTTPRVDLGEFLVPLSFSKSVAKVHHCGQLVLAGSGDRLGVLAASGMRSTSGV